MRAIVPLLVLLVVLAPGAQAWIFLGNYHSTRPGWTTETFTTDATGRIAISYGISSPDEFIGGIVALYTLDGEPLVTQVSASEGGKLIDLAIRSDDINVTNEDAPGPAGGSLYERTIYITCPAACNPTGSFRLVVTAGGELNSWGYGLFVNGGTRGTQRVSGLDAWAVPSREFENSTRIGLPVGGLAVARGATYDLSVDEALLGAWFKPSTARPEVMRIETPSGPAPCGSGCLIDRWAPGAYQLQYSDVDKFGVESYFVGADVDLP